MSKQAAALAEFHEFYGKDKPELGLELRKTLIEEEFIELIQELDAAHGTDAPVSDLQAAYKEMADLVYVIYGLDLHLGGQLDRVFDEVHRSNMSKLWTCETCGGSGLYVYAPGDDTSVIQCPTCHGEGKIVKRREDGKILKPPTYSPADLSFLKEPQDA